MKAVTSDAFPASFTDRIRKVGDVNLQNKLLTTVGAWLLNGPSSLRRFMIRNFILESAELQRVLRDKEQLEAYIRHATVGVWHCSCSCRMGSEDDPMAVTSPSGQVRGVHGLRVVDASIFPMIPCANTNFPTMMVAEKIADDIVNAERRCVGVRVEIGMNARRPHGAHDSPCMTVGLVKHRIGRLHRRSFAQLRTGHGRVVARRRR